MKRPNLMLKTVAALTVFCLSIWAAPAVATMSAYTAEPVFISKSVPPNVMIVLDNSGSMNFNAYGSWPGTDKTVNDEPFEGEGQSSIVTFPVVANLDDLEEDSSGRVYDNGETDLDFGQFLSGIRFQDVKVPKGATILYAGIDFIPSESGANDCTLIIDAHASDNAPAMVTGTGNYNISGRPGTTNTVTWSPGAWATGEGQRPSTDDISAIVQELVDRDGWQYNNDMLFRIASAPGNTGKRAAFQINKGTLYRPRLNISYQQGEAGKRIYYGYFGPEFFYTYSSSAFRYAYKKVAFNAAAGTWSVETMAGGAATLTASDIVTQKLWDGNWLNWLCMRRIDVIRKVLLGGYTKNGRDGTGNQMLYGENADSSRTFRKFFNSSNCAVSPYSGSYTFQMSGNKINVGGTSYYIQVEKKIAFEPAAFLNYDNGDNLAGVLQKIGDQNVRWGNIWFRTGTGSGYSGGYVDKPIGTSMVDLVSSMEGKVADTWTPLAETLYVAMQYFKQEAPASGYDYYDLAVPNTVQGDSDDPYYLNGRPIRCAKSFALMLTDGASTMDGMVPSDFRDYYKLDADNFIPATEIVCQENTKDGIGCTLDSRGTRYLDDVAYYAHTNDLRSDLADGQSFTFYGVYAFGNDPEAQNLLMEASKNGGFEDQNGDKRPDKEEWDADNNGVPDTYYEASDGYLLEARLMAAFGDIAKRAASGTSASVLATNSEGEGNMIQAYFMAGKENKALTDSIRWTGYLQSLWMDGYGRMREDSNNNLTLDEDDAVVEFITDEETGDTKISVNGTEQELENLQPIFESGARLSQRDPASRKIFTFIDANRDGVADDATPDPLDAAGELIAFHTDAAARIKPFLGVAEANLYGTLGMNLGATHDARVTNIIEWVRGTEIDGLRNRTLDGVTHRLGDIVHSTPVTVSKAVDNYHILYSDESYLEYWKAVKDRETMIYVGANDGMLHAFTGWMYGFDDQGRPTYSKPEGTSEEIGDEVWAFIPQAVLPHLKWPAHKNYTHTYLVDGRPRVFDAKIDNTWGTFLVMGLRMGAKHISVTEDFGAGVETRAFDPTYFCLDITDPRNPRLMWEHTYPNLAMTWSRPAPLKVGDKWYLAFGSGPTDYEGASNQPGYLFVADLKTGQLLRRFGPIEGAAGLGYFNDPVTFDKNLNYNVDAFYTTASFLNSGVWNGGVYKIAVPCDNCPWDSDYNPASDPGYAEDPGDWIYSKLFATDRPITAPLSVSNEVSRKDDIDNVWLYFGTGRYLIKNDISNADQQYLFGIKDPYFNRYSGSAYHDHASPQLLSMADLLRTDTFTVTTAGHVLDGATLKYNHLFDLEEEIQKDWDGWYRRLENNGTGPSERIVSKPSLLGGMVFMPSFTPDEDLCNYGGTTNVLALYYTTGTGYHKQIFNIEDPETVMVPNEEGKLVKEEVVAVKLPEGFIGSPPPMAGMHAGQEKGAKAFLQQSSGRVMELDVTPPFYFQGAIIDWWER